MHTIKIREFVAFSSKNSSLKFLGSSNMTSRIPCCSRSCTYSKKNRVIPDEFSENFVVGGWHFSVSCAEISFCTSTLPDLVVYLPKNQSGIFRRIVFVLLKSLSNVPIPCINSFMDSPGACNVSGCNVIIDLAKPSTLLLFSIMISLASQVVASKWSKSFLLRHIVFIIILFTISRKTSMILYSGLFKLNTNGFGEVNIQIISLSN